MISDNLFSVSVRTDTAQPFETAEQARARENIDAQQKIAANGLVKCNGDGGTSSGTPGEDYAVPVTEVSATLAAASWSGTEAPYTQAVAVSGMTSSKKAIVGLPHSATSAQYLAASAALLHVTAQGTDTITVTAEGDAPEIDIPVLVEIVG